MENEMQPVASDSFELLKPRTFSEVIEDGFAFLRQNFDAFKGAFIKALLPFIIVIAIVEALSNIIMPLGSTGDTGQVLAFTIFLAIITIGLNLVLFFRQVSIIVSALVLKANDREQKISTTDLLYKMRENFGHVVVCVLIWIPLYFIIAIPMIIITVPFFMTGTFIIPFIIMGVFFFAFLPVAFYAIYGAFPATLFENMNYFSAFFKNINWGYSKFFRTWIISFLVLVIFFVFSVLPLTLASIPELFLVFGGGDSFLGNLPFLQSLLILIGSLFATTFSTATSFLIFAIFGVYYFSLKEEIDSVAFNEKMEEMSEPDKPEQTDTERI